MNKVILAFSGGLDTSFCIPFLKEKGYEVITVTVNTGGFSFQQLKQIEKKAKQLGSEKHYTKDAQNTLYKYFASYLIKANYLKGGVYPACVGPERNVIAEEVAAIANLEKTKIVAHGSTGAGNDQVRFDLALKALIPEVVIVAPIRDENLTRKQEVEFLQKNGFDINTEKSKYSINIGLLGTTISGAETLNLEQKLPDEIWPTVKTSGKKEPAYFTLQFQKGLPTGLNGKKMTGIKIIKKLNQIGAANGFGKDYHIGTTIIGIKGRIAFEAPGLKILIKAHGELEKIVLTSKQIFWKSILGTTYGDFIHEGLYFDPLLRNIEAFLDSANAHVEGEVGIQIHKGNFMITSLKSPYSLMSSKFGIYGEKIGSWSGKEARGFCKLYGMESTHAFFINKKI
ncbi:argininosuccinate synthase [Candidatus Peregrinibacteria bacterium]|nr:argininosuccinate synthase [Candidatus Peregrinibacteria bacterium]